MTEEFPFTTQKVRGERHGEENNQKIFHFCEKQLAVEMKAVLLNNRVVDFTVYFENTGEKHQQITDINAYDLNFKPPSRAFSQHVGSLENPGYVAMGDEIAP